MITEFSSIHIIMLIRICYGRYNSFRDQRIGEQRIRKFPLDFRSEQMPVS